MDRLVVDVLSAHLGGDWVLRPLGASHFCATWRAVPAARTSAGGALFVKSAPCAQAPMLRAEADGLLALAAAACLRIPTVAG